MFILYKILLILLLSVSFLLPADTFTEYLDPVTGQWCTVVKDVIALKFSPQLFSRDRSRILTQMRNENSEIRVNEKSAVSGRGVSLALSTAAAQNALERIIEKSIPVEITVSGPLDNAIQRYRAYRSVSAAEPVFVYFPVDFVYNDSLFSAQWALTAQGMNITNAWKITNLSSAPIAVIDSGFFTNHDDLKNIRWTNAYDVTDSTSDVRHPSSTHGTLVAGCIGATSHNSIGTSGVISNSVIIPIKAMGDSSSGFYSTHTAAAIDYAVNYGARIINMSLGGTGFSAIIESACERAYQSNVTVVAAAGNSGTITAIFPAAYPSVIAVASINSNRVRSPFSSYGTHLDVCAPGEYIWSSSFSSNTSTYEAVNGTSFAAPYVSAVLGLCLGVQPGLSNYQLRNFLRQSAADLGDSGFDIHYGYGAADASALLTAVSNSTSLSSNRIVCAILFPSNYTHLLADTVFRVHGYADTTAVFSNRLSFGEGNSPQIWSAAGTVTGSITNNAAFSFSIAGMVPDVYTFRLETFTAGGIAEDRKTIYVGGPGVLCYGGRDNEKYRQRYFIGDITGTQTVAVGYRYGYYGDSYIIRNTGNNPVSSFWPYQIPGTVSYIHACSFFSSDPYSSVLFCDSLTSYADIIGYSGSRTRIDTPIKGYTRYTILRTGDINADGSDELLYNGYLSSSGKQSGSYYTWTYRFEMIGQNGTVYADNEIFDQNASHLVGDIDLDGYEDIVFRQISFLNNGTSSGKFGESIAYINAKKTGILYAWPDVSMSYSEFSSVYDTAFRTLQAIADINNDRSPDVLFSRYTGGNVYYNAFSAGGALIYKTDRGGIAVSAANLPYVWLVPYGTTNGAGVILQTVNPSNTGYYAHHIFCPAGTYLWCVQDKEPLALCAAVGDIDGDAVPDVVIGRSSGDFFQYTLTGVLVKKLPFGAMAAPYEIYIRDFDRSGSTGIFIKCEDDSYQIHTASGDPRAVSASSLSGNKKNQGLHDLCDLRLVKPRMTFPVDGSVLYTGMKFSAETTNLMQDNSILGALFYGVQGGTNHVVIGRGPVSPSNDFVLEITATNLNFSAVYCRTIDAAGDVSPASDLITNLRPFTNYVIAKKIEARNAPNPFSLSSHPYTLINTFLPKAELIVRIYTYSGVLIRILETAGTEVFAEKGTAEWDGLNENGQPVAPGVYFFTVEGKHDSAVAEAFSAEKIDFASPGSFIIVTP